MYKLDSDEMQIYIRVFKIYYTFRIKTSFEIDFEIYITWLLVLLKEKMIARIYYALDHIRQQSVMES